MIEKTCFIYDIVSNKRNSIDVDKIDYLQRDAYYLGMSTSCDFSRLLQNNRVMEDQLCFEKTEQFNLMELFRTRYRFFKQVYTHPVVRAVDHMIKDALILANRQLHLEEIIFCPEKYIYLTDHIIESIVQSPQDVFIFLNVGFK